MQKGKTSNGMFDALARKDPVREFNVPESEPTVRDRKAAKPAPKTAKKPQPVKPPKEEVEKQPMRMLSVRIPHDLDMALFDAQLDRKRNKAVNHQRQDLVGEILKGWLKEHKFLK